MTNDEAKRGAIDLGRLEAARACVEIAAELKNGGSPEGVLARSAKNLFVGWKAEPWLQDLTLEGFCDELQKFIEHSVTNPDKKIQELLLIQRI